MALSPPTKLPLTELYLMRHGSATERGTYRVDDDRPLTDAGRARTRAVALRLLALGCQSDQIFTSPLVRAQQTAEILLDVGLAPTVELSAALAPGGELADWLPARAQWQAQSSGRLALVGHEPDLSHWAQQLVTGQVSDRWRLKKAGVIGLHVPAAETAIGNSELFWLTPPRLLL